MRNTGPTADQRAAVLARDQERCVVCGIYCARPGDHSLQHRKARGMGGTRDPQINAPTNLLTVCGDGTRGCHGLIEGHPAWAQLHGFAVPQWQDPAFVPVDSHIHGSAYLTADGAWLPIGRGPEALSTAVAHIRALCVERGIPVDAGDEDYVRLSVAIFDAVQHLTLAPHCQDVSQAGAR